MNPPPTTLTILRLGAQGDGVAEHEGKQVFVPLALPGETVVADIAGDRARLLSIIAPDPARQPARCSHYGECGGCSLQHLPADRYLTLKRDLVVTALSFQGISAAVDDVLPVPPATRRRAVFAAHRRNNKIVVGFHGKRSHHIVGIRDCAILTPGLVALLAHLAPLAAIAAPRQDALTITATETVTGLDVALTGAPKGVSADARASLAKAAEAMGLARLSINGVVEMERVAPVLRFGEADVTPPPGVDQDAYVDGEGRQVSRAVHDLIASLNGSISAEHGIGLLKRDELELRKSAVEMDMMRAVKRALDPDNRMNPGRVV